MKKLLLIGLWACAGLIACVTGRETEKKSAFNYLNGEHYRQQGSNLVPILERQAVSTKIQGQLFLASDPIPVEYRFQQLSLFKSGKPLLETRSNAAGNFSFVGEIPNGSYEIRLVSERYEAVLAVDVTSYELSGLTLTAKPRDTLSKK